MTKRLGVLWGVEEMDRIQSCALCEGVTAVSTKFPVGQTGPECGCQEQRTDMQV